MARVTVFSYKKGNSLLHRLDPRFKLFYMVLLSMGTLSSGFVGLIITTLLIFTVLLAAQVNILGVPRELKVFPVFLLFILVTRSLTTPGEAIFSVSFLTPTHEGLLLGLHFCWRLTLVVLISLGFIVSTTSNQIKAAVEFYFGMIPGVPEKRISTMLSLLIRFIPIIMSQVQDTIDAQNARCVELRKNPVYRLVKLTIPLLHRIFLNGDQLAIAMTSRCYTEDRTGLDLYSSRLDWLSLPVLIFLTILMQFI
ncbi:MAG: biotin transport system permease protein [Desulforhopalus sp.]|jgi:biotin transport system permease protein